MKKRILPAVALLAFVVVAPVSAATIERERYSGTDSFDFDDCGFVIHDEVEFRGVFMLKAPKSPGAPPRYFDKYHVHEVMTANGKTMTIDHNGLYKDLHITHVEGTIYQFVAKESGQPFVVRDGQGRVLLKDRGVLVTTFQVDTKGDSDLDNDEFIEGSWSLLADHGRHPAFYLDFCDIVSDYFLG